MLTNSSYQPNASCFSGSTLKLHQKIQEIRVHFCHHNFFFVKHTFGACLDIDISKNRCSTSKYLHRNISSLIPKKDCQNMLNLVGFSWCLFSKQIQVHVIPELGHSVFTLIHQVVSSLCYSPSNSPVTQTLIPG